MRDVVAYVNLRYHGLLTTDHKTTGQQDHETNDYEPLRNTQRVPEWGITCKGVRRCESTNVRSISDGACRPRQPQRRQGFEM